MSDATILVVDDAPIQVRLMDQVLNKHYRVIQAGSGEEALAAARSRAPDLILLDIQMPGMDGFAVFHALQAEEALRDIPVVFLTALDAEQDQVQALEAGGADYITKPCPARILLARVRTQLELKRSRDRLAESEARYRALFLHSPQPVAVWRIRDGLIRLEEHNLAAQRLCQRLMGPPGIAPGDAPPDLPGLAESLEQCLRAGREERFDLHAKDLAGRPVRLAAHFVSVPPDTALMVCEEVAPA
ncbi:MAG: response regulator [Thermodesulfobacteriota bacterium]